jgi:prepilin-type N-terminal cleavage/methylation domain-containing protein
MVNRNGFSLAEVVVALLLLSVVAVGVAGAGVAAAQMFTRAEMHERLLREAQAILDSLVVLPANGAGTRVVNESQLVWTAADSTRPITLFVHLPGRSIQFTAQR